MKTVLLNGEMLKDKNFHEYFKKKLKIIGYYGNNLDAMYDAISTYNEELKLYVFNLDEENQSVYGKSIINTLEELSDLKENIGLKIIDIKRIH